MGKPSNRGFSRAVKPTGIHSQGEKLAQSIELVKELQTDSRDRSELEHMLVYELKPKIETIIKKVFIKFCQGHKLEESKIEEEWINFRKILRRHL